MLESSDILEFKKKAKKITLKRGQYFVKENEVCDLLGVVEQGALYSYFEDADANKIVNELYSKDSIITSYRSFMTELPSRASIKAYSDCEVYVLTKTEYVDYSKNHQWLDIFKKIADDLFVRKCFKEMALIRLQAKDRFLELIDSRKHIEQDFPQYLIASYLKIRPETLSRLKSLI